MKTRLAVLAAAGLALGGCYYPYYGYGDPYVASSALVGAGLGAAAGAAIASAPYYAPRPYYYAPRSYGYSYGYGPGYGRYRGW